LCTKRVFFIWKTPVFFYFFARFVLFSADNTQLHGFDCQPKITVLIHNS